MGPKITKLIAPGEAKQAYLARIEPGVVEHQGHEGGNPSAQKNSANPTMTPLRNRALRKRDGFMGGGVAVKMRKMIRQGRDHKCYQGVPPGEVGCATSAPRGEPRGSGRRGGGSPQLTRQLPREKGKSNRKPRIGMRDSRPATARRDDNRSRTKSNGQRERGGDDSEYPTSVRRARSLAAAHRSAGQTPPAPAAGGEFKESAAAGR